MTDYIIKNIKDFDLSQTLECGQCFRFYKQDEQDYIVVAYGKMLHISQEGGNLIFHNTSEEEYEKIWRYYFDLDRDYGKIKKYLVKYDNKLEEAITQKSGIRILNQEYFETLISFIISQNKQIPHIKKIVWGISEKFGECIGKYNGEKYYSFPSIEQLASATEQDFIDLKAGFRAKYLVDAIERNLKENITKETFMDMSNQEVIDKLQEIKGVGSKVANCVMLFGLGRRDAFPVDVWIKRIMESLYFEEETKNEVIEKFGKEHFGEYGGYAQQYLFYYAKDK